MFPELDTYMTALLQPKVGNKRNFNGLSKEMRELTGLVSDALYNFSKGKLLWFLRKPEFAFILKQYLDRPFNIDQVKTNLE